MADLRPARMIRCRRLLFGLPPVYTVEALPAAPRLAATPALRLA